jgi:hypothetical protein
VPFNGGNEEEVMRHFPLAVKVVGGGHGGSARPITAAATPALFGAGGGRKRLAGPGGPKRLSGSAGPLSQKPGGKSFLN